MVLDADPAFHVLASCAAVEEVVEAAERLSPQRVSMDNNLSGTSGIETTTISTAQAPATKGLSHSLRNQWAYARTMLSATAICSVIKTFSPQPVSDEVYLK